MQGGSVFEDIAERVLKVGPSSFLTFSLYVSHWSSIDPNDADAKYVHFSTRRYPLGSSSFLYPCDNFHSTGCGRQPAEYAMTCILDELIKAHPQRLGLFRTQGIALSGTSIPLVSRTSRMRSRRPERYARPCSSHRNGSHTPRCQGKGERDRKRSKSNGQAPSNGTSDADWGGDTSETETPPKVHPSVLPDASGPLGSTSGPKLQAY